MWRSLGHDPYFEIAGPFEPGWYRATWKLGAETPLQPAFFVQFAAPLRDWVVVRCGTGAAGACVPRDHLLRFGHAVRRVLFQPLAAPGAFRFQEFNLVPEPASAADVLYPMRDIAGNGRSWESLGDDPAFECVWSRPAGYYRFQWRAGGPFRLAFKLYFGADGRFSESMMVSTSGGRPGVLPGAVLAYSLLAHVPEGTTHVQLHPCECDGPFLLDGFGAEPVPEPALGELYAARQVEPIASARARGPGHAYLSLGVDPALEMRSDMPPGWYDISWRASAAFPLDMRLYFGRGSDGFGEIAATSSSPVVCPAERSFRVRVRLEEWFDRIQLHPSPDRAGPFTLRDVRVRRLGWMRNWLADAGAPSISSRPDVRHWFADYLPPPGTLSGAAETSRHWSLRPLVSIVLPVFEPNQRYLREAIESVLAQAYPHWELCIADDASPGAGPRDLLQEYCGRDPRIRVVFRESNGHIAAATNSALALARGDFVGFLDQDDALHPLALHDVVERLQRSPGLDLVYTDEDKVDELGRHLNPVFKPAWSPETLLSKMYVCHFLVIRRSLVEALGGLCERHSGAQDHDLVLRASERTDAIAHVPRVRYHWRVHAGSVAGAPQAKPYAFERARHVLEEALRRRGETGIVRPLERFPGHFELALPPGQRPLVSIIVPFRDQLEVTGRCVASILERSTWEPLEVVLVDNESEPLAAGRFRAEWMVRGAGRVRFISWPHAFNFAALNNAAASQARGELVVFLNNDTEVISPDWLERMAAQALRPPIGAVGAKLLYPDGTVQHAGVILGVGGVAGHAHQFLASDEPGCGVTLQTATNYAAVTGACLMCRREVFREVGGFDVELAVAYNDVDLCLRLLAAGYRNVYVPAELYHRESLTRGEEDLPEKQRRFERETGRMSQRWGALIAADPYLNPAFSRRRHDFAFDPMPPEAAASGDARIDIARRVVLNPAVAMVLRGSCAFRSGAAPARGWMYVDGREVGSLEWPGRIDGRAQFAWPVPATLREGPRQLEVLVLSTAGERVSARALVDMVQSRIDPDEAARVQAMRRQVPFELPRQAFVEVTTACDLACVMCRYDVKGKDVATDLFIGRDTFARIEPLIEALRVVHLYGWGEPTLHPGYIDLVRSVRARNPDCRIVFTSNFSHVTERMMSAFVEQRVDMINVSIDGASAPVYEQIRRHGSFERLLANVQALRQMKERCGSRVPYLQYECVVQRDNVHELAGVVDLVASLGGDVLTLEHVSDMPHLEIDYRTWLPAFTAARERAYAAGVRLVGSAVARFEQARGREPRRSQQPAIACHEPFQTVYVNPGGTISPCCMNPVVLGDLATQSLEEIWFGRRYGDFREAILAGNFDARCRTCIAEGKNQPAMEGVAGARVEPALGE